MPKIRLKGKQVAEETILSSNIRDYTILQKDISLSNLTGEIFSDNSIGAIKLSNDVTKQGNSFNGPNQLLKLDSSGKIPNSLIGDIELSSQDLLDVEGPINSANGLVKLTNTGELLLNNPFILKSIDFNPVVSVDECKLYYSGLDSKFHLKTNSYNLAIHLEVFNETPSGVIDGVNNEFFLANTPILNTERVYVNGLREKNGSGYLMVGNRIVFTDPPKPGYEIVVDYKY